MYITQDVITQVFNITPCVKLAADFLAPQSLERCSKVNSLMHASKSSDVLEFGYLIIHCWMALSQLSKSLPASPELSPSSPLPDIAAGDPATADSRTWYGISVWAMIMQSILIFV